MASIMIIWRGFISKYKSTKVKIKLDINKIPAFAGILIIASPHLQTSVTL